MNLFDACKQSVEHTAQRPIGGGQYAIIDLTPYGEGALVDEDFPGKRLFRAATREEILFWLALLDWEPVNPREEEIS